MSGTPSSGAASEIGDTRAPFLFIILTLVIDSMGIGLILPVMPDLIREISGGDLGSAAVWGGVLATLFAVMQFLFGPTVGSLSDRYGRRPVLLVSMAVIAVDFIVMGLAHAMWLLILTRIIGGIAAATQSAATAFIADISPPEKKAQNFGIVGAAFGAGFVLGPLIGGLLGEFGHRAPFYMAGVLAACNFLLGYFVLPETVTDRIRRPFEWRRANPIGAFASMKRLPGMLRYLLIVFLYEFAFIVYPAVWAYYTIERFGWSVGMVGVSLACFGISMAIVQGFLIRYILAWLGEMGTLLYGFIFNFFIFILLVVIDTGWIVLALTPITAFGAVVTPALQGVMSKRAADNQQGELQGVVASVKSVAMILSPLAMTWVFFAFTRPDGAIYMPGAPFAVSLALMVACFIVFVAGRPKEAVEAT